jgi:hypothetical protein
MKQISRSEFVQDAGEVLACPLAVSRRPEKQIVFILK